MATISELKASVFDIIRQQEYLEGKKKTLLADLSKLEKEEYEKKQKEESK
jgi:hypothetical protein